MGHAGLFYICIYFSQVIFTFIFRCCYSWFFYIWRLGARSGAGATVVLADVSVGGAGAGGGGAAVAGAAHVIVKYVH